MITVWHEMLETQARVRADAPALSYKSQTLSYAELWDLARHVGSALAGLGVAREDRVAVFLEKRPETVAAFLGASVAGGAFVPVNPLLKPPQVAHILSDCAARVLVTSAARLELLRDVLEGCPELEQVVVVDGPVTTPFDVATHDWADLLDAAPQPVPAAGIDLDMAAIFYTSGSTGLPKGVVLSHRNLVVGAQSVSPYLGNIAEDVILSVLPLSFDAGCRSSPRPSMSAPTSCCSITASRGRPAGLRTLEGHGDRLCAAVVDPDCGCGLARGCQGVAPVLRQHGRADAPDHAGPAARGFPGASPYLMYGLTEAFRSTYLTPSEMDRRPDSIGKAMPNAEILVVRPDGTLCGAGRAGRAGPSRRVRVARLLE